MQITSIDQLKLMAEVSPYSYTKFSRKEYPFLRQSITIDLAGNILYHHHQRETPLSPKTKPRSIIGEGNVKVIKNLFDEHGNPIDIVRGIYNRIEYVGERAFAVMPKIRGKPHLLPCTLVYERKIITDDKGNIIKVVTQPVLYMPKLNTDLEQVIKNNGFTEKQKLQIMYDIALGVSEIHALKLAHRDIKPSNICIEAKQKISLLDFDFLTDSKERARGTPLFASPEYNKWLKKYDVHQSQKMDIYSLGITFHLFYNNITTDEFNYGSYADALQMLYDATRADTCVDDSGSDTKNSDINSVPNLSSSSNLSQSYSNSQSAPASLGSQLKAVFDQFKKDHQDTLLSQFKDPDVTDTMLLIGKMVSWDPEDRPPINEIIKELVIILHNTPP